ncbi:hypothetical protein V496_10466 [Pseudogymnoascus sp. VKM F-4515 (FW-2607)]|nr:hypothetical protein V496_10466 [Pseudogymnoascus sp. VKM F-4515 (FW-2607)]
MSEQSGDAVPPSSVLLARSADRPAEPKPPTPVATPANEAEEQPLSGMDVTLSKVMALAKISMDEFQPVIGEAPILLEEKDEWAAAGIASLSGRSPRSRALPGGRLIATYKMVELGELAYDAEVAYKHLSGVVGDSKDLDASTLDATPSPRPAATHSAANASSAS